MTATQAMTGQGGWPMTCFLTPDGRAVLLRHLLPDAPQLPAACSTRSTTGLARRRRDEVRSRPPGRSPAQLADGRRRCRRPRPSMRRRAAGRRRRGRCADEVRRERRRVRRRAEVPAVDDAGVPAAPPRAHRARRRRCAMADRDLRAMARGGIYDQLAGGFARYSVDARWVVPHFEKMLYDNALLLRVYAHWCRRHRAIALARRVAAETAGVPARATWARRGRLRLGAGRRHRRRRGPDLRLDARPAARGARAPTTAPGPRELFDGHRRRAPSSTARSMLQLPADPADPAALANGSGPRCWPRATGARSPAATTRWSPPGTGWRSPRWPRRAPRWTGRTGSSRRRRAPPTCCSTCTSSTAGCAASSATAWSAPRPGCWRTTPRWPTALLALHQATGAARWLDGRRRAARRRPSRSSPTARSRRVLRHRRRRRGAAAPAPRDHRQRHAVRGSALAAALLTASALTDRRPAGTGRRPRRRCTAAGTLLARAPAVRRALAGRRPRRCSRAAPGRGGRRRADRRRPRWPAPGGPPRAARWSSPASRTPRRAAAGRPAPGRRRGPRPTSAAASSATAPSPPEPTRAAPAS